jgi:hypothetical protein
MHFEFYFLRRVKQLFEAGIEPAETRSAAAITTTLRLRDNLHS